MFRDIVETSPDGIWLLELTGRTIYANPAMSAMLGRRPEDMSDLTLLDTLDEQGRRDYADHLARLVDGIVNDQDVEVLLHRADGTAFWALAREQILPADEAEGLPDRLFVRFSDWDDRRALADREARVRETLAAAEQLSGLGSWSTDMDRGVVTATAGLLGMLDLPVGRAIVREDIFELVHPDDGASVADYVSWDMDDGPFAYEARMRTHQGYRWFAGRIARRWGRDGRETRLATIFDIHDRRVAEEGLEDAVLQNVLLQAAAAAANEARTFDEGLRLSQQLILATGDWQRARAFLPVPDGGPALPYYVNEVDREADLADPRHVPVEQALAARCAAEGRLMWEEAAWDGGPMVAFPVQVPGEVVAVGVISSSTPIERPDLIRSVLAQAGSQMARVAERDRAARELAQARDAAMEASQQKSDFLATMSHEIRTPLNGVIGLNALLLRTALDPDQQRLVEGIQVSSRSLLGIINDILDFSKIEAGHLAMEEMDFEVRGVLDQVAAVIGESARARDLELVVSCDPAVPTVLSGDPTRLAQVLTNLGSNAVKFTESGSVQVRVGVGSAADIADGAGGSAAPDAVVLTVEVTDTGVGIPAEQHAAIFDPFAQADASTTRRFGGTGLGLAICREIVEALHGRMGVRSTPGRGSTFWFTARFGPADGDGVSEEDALARAALAGRRVLVVDDNEHNRMILAEQVGWWGVRCTTVTSVGEGVAALEAAEAEGDAFDMVLLDLAMPERDGFDLAAEVRARPGLVGVPMLMLSSALAPEPERLRAAGIAGSLTKPVLATTLRTLLVRYLAPAESPATTSLPAGATLDAPESFRPRVLVVEDNQVNQMVASGLLDALGYLADVVDDGDGAVQAVAAATPGYFGAILMDLQMPRVDGFEATRAIRELERGSGRIDDERGRVPIIAMTASAISGERERCLAAGMDDFLTKPVDPRTLAAMMDRWVARVDVSQAPDVSEGPDGSEGQESPELMPSSGSVEGPLDRARLDMLREVDEEGTYLERVLGRFEDNHAALVGAVAEAVAASDVEALQQAAHSLKGTLTNLGLVRAGALAFELEQLATEGSADADGDAVPDLRAAVSEGLGLLRTYRREHAPGAR